MAAARAAGERAEADRIVGRAEARRADRRDRQAARSRRGWSGRSGSRSCPGRSPCRASCSASGARPTRSLRAARAAHRTPSRRSASRRRPCPCRESRRAAADCRSRVRRLRLLPEFGGAVGVDLEAERPRRLRAGARAFRRGRSGIERAADRAGGDPCLARLAGQEGVRSPRRRPAAPPAWLARWTSGFQPAETSSASHAGRAARPRRGPSPASKTSIRDRFQRLAAARCGDDVAGQAFRPGSRTARCARRRAPRARGSTTARTGTPARDSAAARRQPPSLLVKTTTSPPTATP